MYPHGCSACFKALFTTLKNFSRINDWKGVVTKLEMITAIKDMPNGLTPSELQPVFPIEKSYDLEELVTNRIRISGSAIRREEGSKGIKGECCDNNNIKAYALTEDDIDMRILVQ